MLLVILSVLCPGEREIFQGCYMCVHVSCFPVLLQAMLPAPAHVQMHTWKVTCEPKGLEGNERYGYRLNALLLTLLGWKQGVAAS